MAEYTFTAPIVKPDEVGVSFDSLTIYANRTVSVLLAVKDASGATVRNIGPIFLRDADESFSLVPTGSLATIRTWAWPRVQNALSQDPNQPDLPAGSGT